MYLITVYGDELYHHGIQGQKWGLRRFQNKDGTYTKAGKNRRNSETKKAKLTKRFTGKTVDKSKFKATSDPTANEDYTKKKGEKVWHVTPSATFNKLNKGQSLYISATDEDRHTYRSFLSMMLKAKGFKTIKEVELTLNEDLKAPSNDNQKKIFKGVYDNNKEVFDREISDYYSRHKNKPDDTYDQFIKMLDDSKHNESKTMFYDAVKNSGYNAILDQHDVDYSWMNAKKPLIVMDAVNMFGDIKVSDISEKEIEDSLKKLGVLEK